jgi:hypothetical protein
MMPCNPLNHFDRSERWRGVFDRAAEKSIAGEKAKARKDRLVRSQTRAAMRGTAVSVGARKHEQTAHLDCRVLYPFAPR